MGVRGKRGVPEATNAVLVTDQRTLFYIAHNSEGVREASERLPELLKGPGNLSVAHSKLRKVKLKARGARDFDLIIMATDAKDKKLKVMGSLKPMPGAESIDEALRATGVAGLVPAMAAKLQSTYKRVAPAASK